MATRDSPFMPPFQCNFSSGQRMETDVKLISSFTFTKLGLFIFRNKYLLAAEVLDFMAISNCRVSLKKLRPATRAIYLYRPVVTS